MDDELESAASERNTTNICVPLIGHDGRLIGILSVESLDPGDPVSLSHMIRLLLRLQFEEVLRADAMRSVELRRHGPDLITLGHEISARVVKDLEPEAAADDPRKVHTRVRNFLPYRWKMGNNGRRIGRPPWVRPPHNC